MTDQQKITLMQKAGLIIGALGVYLFLSLLSGCQVVKKIVHKKRTFSDSTIVTHRDSTGVTKEEKKEKTISFSDVEFEVQYDTTIQPIPITPINASDYFSDAGKVLSDVIKASTQGGKPKKIIIKAGKVDKKETQSIKTDSTRIKSDQQVRVVKKDESINKDIKTRSYWGWLWLLLLIPIIYYRKKIIAIFSLVKNVLK